MNKNDYNFIYKFKVNNIMNVIYKIQIFYCIIKDKISFVFS